MLIFVEGDRDEEFFELALGKKIRKKYGVLGIIKYMAEPDSEKTKYANMVKKDCENCIIITDLDRVRCMTGKKQRLDKLFHVKIPKDRIIIAKLEIEGWAQAGLTSAVEKQFGFKYCTSTESVTKEQFYHVGELSGRSQAVFLKQVLRKFNFETAKKRNSSFAYFAKKFL